MCFPLLDRGENVRETGVFVYVEHGHIEERKTVNNLLYNFLEVYNLLMVEVRIISIIRT